RDQLLQRARALKIGDPLDESVDYGPFINERFLERWIEQREVGLEDGARLLLDGRRVTPADAPASFAGDAERGLYAAPRIFEDVTCKNRIALVERFGQHVTHVHVCVPATVNTP